MRSLVAPVLLFVAWVVVGCGEQVSTPTATPTAEGVAHEGRELTAVAFDEDGPVLQIEVWPGFIAAPSNAAAKVPWVTIWGDGRVVFTTAEDRDDPQRGLIREARLDEATVERLVSEASMLYEQADGLNAFPQGIYISDLSTIVFSVWSEEGRKSVGVYGLNVSEPSRFEGETEPLMGEFRALYRSIVEALPADAPMMVPEEVTVATHDQPTPIAWPTQDWPTDLLGHLTGADVERALEWLDVGPVMVAWVDGVPHNVTIIPVLPVLSQPELGHPPFPLAPHAVGYRVWGESIVDGPTRMEYRFEEEQVEEIAGWYRYVMPKIWGWRGGKDTATEQVWVLDDVSRPQMVEVRFDEGHLTIEPVRFDAGYPEYPDGEWGSCGDRGCQFVAGVTIDEARAWFAEQLGYLGWEGGPEVFRRPWTVGDGASYDRLTLTFYERGGGVVMLPTLTTVHPNDQLPYPTPTPPGG